MISEPLPHFIDDLLGYLHETHPTYATLDGVHRHDDLLEDFSAHAMEGQAHALSGYLRRLAEIDPQALTGAERLEHRMLVSHIRGRMFELEHIRTWESNPQIYADMLASSLAAQAVFTHASADERARRVLSKLRQAPRLIQAARDNIKDPPGIFVKVGIETLAGALKFIDKELPRAFSNVDDMHLLGDFADAQTEASQALGAYIEYLRNRTSRQGPARPSAWAATSSSRNSSSKRGLRCRSIVCWRSPCASSRPRRTSSERSREGSTAATPGDLGASQGGAPSARRAIAVDRAATARGAHDVH